jgi:hypothetical protein
MSGGTEEDHDKLHSSQPVYRRETGKFLAVYLVLEAGV